MDGKTKPDKLHVKPYQKSHGGPRKTRTKNVPDDTKKGIVEETKSLYVSKVGDLRTRWVDSNATFYELERDLRYCKRVWLKDTSGNQVRVPKRLLLEVLDRADEAKFDVHISSKGLIAYLPGSMYDRLKVAS